MREHVHSSASSEDPSFPLHAAHLTSYFLDSRDILDRLRRLSNKPLGHFWLSKLVPKW